MHAMLVAVIPEFHQLSREINGVPEENAAQVSAPDRADQTRNERMRNRCPGVGAEEVDTPEAILRLGDEGQPGRALWAGLAARRRRGGEEPPVRAGLHGACGLRHTANSPLTGEARSRFDALVGRAGGERVMAIRLARPMLRQDCVLVAG